MMALSRAVFYVEGTAEGFGVDKAHVAHGRTSVWTGGRASAASAHGCSARIAGRSAFVDAPYVPASCSKAYLCVVTSIVGLNFRQRLR